MNRDKDKQFRQEAFNAFTQGLLRRGRSEVGATDFEQVLLEGMLVPQASLLLLWWGEVRVRTLLGPGHRLLLDVLNGCGPAQELLIVRMLLFEVMHIA